MAILSTSARGAASAATTMIERPVDPNIKKAARIIAVRCRHVIQSVLRDEEKAECDREFTEIAETVIGEMAAFKKGNK